MSGKEAIVFILDSNHSMNAPYPPGGYTTTSTSPSAVGGNPPSPIKSNPTAINVDEYDDATVDLETQSTRLSSAKDSILAKISELAFRSKTNEVGVVVLKTKRTHHHMFLSDAADDGLSKLFRSSSSRMDNYYDDDDDENPPFPNLVEFNLNRPSPHLLRDIHSIQSTTTPHPSSSSTIQGDFCDGIILAADTLYRRTAGKKYIRKIILFTDAEHEVRIDGEQLETVLSGLEKMDCSLEVVGIGFDVENTGSFRIKEEEKVEGDEGEGDEDGDGGADSDENDVEEETDVKEEGDADGDNLKMDVGQSENDIKLLIKRENEKLLVSLAQQTGGCVMAANGQDISALLETNDPRNNEGMTKSIRGKCEFRIAPNITVPVILSKYVDAATIPYLKREAYVLDSTTGLPQRDGLGELITCGVDRNTTHWIEEDPDVPNEGLLEVPLDSRTDAYRFGSDLIPVGKMDMLGIKAAFASPRSIEMIGYISKRDVISSGLCMGPAYVVLGGKESKKSRGAIAALSLAMEEKGVWGFCRFVKSVNGDPCIGVLIPKLVGSDGGNGEGGRFLALLQLPFADDISHISTPAVPAENWGDDKEAKACDSLVESMMLEDDELDSTTISSPSIQAYRRMITHFAMDPLTGEVELNGDLPEEKILMASHASPLCEFGVVKSLSMKASNQINAFLETFPREKIALDGDKKENKKHWGDGK
eukprot:scaffold536_cov193-Alexandrium_tamarense.AAC.3